MPIEPNGETTVIDRGALVPLLTGVHNQLLAYILALLGNRQDAEDVLQRTSLVLWQKFDQFEPGSDFLAWACTIAFYEVRNFRRISGRDRLRFDDALLETLSSERRGDLARSADRMQALEHCLGKLDEASRGLIRRVYGGREEIKRIAGEMGWAPQTLYNRLNKIRRILVACVELRLAEEGD
jgi:RNA polymerase sigma-70 factor (ECF subfamily)